MAQAGPSSLVSQQQAWLVPLYCLLGKYGLIMSSTPLAEIFVEGLSVICILGDLPHERLEPQEIRIDLHAQLDSCLDLDSDSLDDSVDYVALASLATTIAQTGNFRLVEALASKLAREALQQFPKLSAIRIQITKAHCISNARSSGIILSLTRP